MKAPLGTIVKEEPLQIVPLLTATVGRVLTVMVATVPTELTHPSALVPVTVYDELFVGLTTALPPE